VSPRAIARRSSYFDDDEPLPEARETGWWQQMGRPRVPIASMSPTLRRAFRLPRTVPPTDDEFYRHQPFSQRAGLFPERAASRAPANDENWNAGLAPCCGDGRPIPIPPHRPEASRFRDSASAANSSPALGGEAPRREAPSEIRRGEPIRWPAANPCRLQPRGQVLILRAHAMPPRQGSQGPRSVWSSRSGQASRTADTNDEPSSGRPFLSPGRSAPPGPDPKQQRVSPATKQLPAF